VELDAVWDTDHNGRVGADDHHTHGGSGAMINSHQVLTAGHCIYDENFGGYADWVFVYPPFRTSPLRFPRISPSLSRFSDWWSVPAAVA
jgi:hypothetical protein